MFRIKKSFILFLLLSFTTLTGYAQEGTPTPATTTENPDFKRFSTWSVGISTLAWNDKLKLRQGVLSDTDFANYNAFIVSLQKEFNMNHWGYTIGIFGGAGQANGGGNSDTINYQEGKVNFSVVGIAPRVFYHLSDKISAGVSALIFSRMISWPESAGLTIDAGRNINATILADLNLRIFNHWDFYQGVGPASEGSTLWKLGLSYRF